MTDKKKTEVNLEMCSGFFRIPTDDIIYNITVLASNEPSTTKVVEKIIEVEKIVEVEKPGPPPAPVAQPTASDDFFERCAKKFQQEISLIAKEISMDANTSTTNASLAPIRDIADMAGELKHVLQSLKSAVAQQEGTGGSNGANLTPALERLSEKISQATGLGSTDSDTPVSQTVTPPTTKTIIRHLFNLDAVFQTIYELCTNETVKSHIQNARAKAEEIFDKNTFYDKISPKVSGYTEDDGFLTVPMTDIYTALSSACNDKATCNLLSKMDKQQASIFLDQFLPLEIPPKEEISIADEDSTPNADTELAPSKTSTNGGLVSLLSECQADLDKLIYQSAEQTSPGLANSDDLITQIEDAMVIAASILHDASGLAQENTATSPRQCSPLELKIKGLETLAETMLNVKAQKKELPFDEALAAGLNASQCRIEEMSARIQSQTSSPIKQKTPEKKPDTAAPAGEASQDDIDRLLAELG